MTRSDLLTLRNLLWSRDRAAWSEISDALYGEPGTDDYHAAMVRAEELWVLHVDTHVVDDPDAGGAE